LWLDIVMLLPHQDETTIHVEEVHFEIVWFIVVNRVPCAKNIVELQKPWI